MKNKESIKWIVYGAITVTAMLIRPDMLENIMAFAMTLFLMGLLMGF